MPIAKDSAHAHSAHHAISSGAPKLCTATGLSRGYAAHSRHATFMTTAMETGAKLEDVQRIVGSADPATTQL
jgi:integrase/recombinase XerD